MLLKSIFIFSLFFPCIIFAQIQTTDSLKVKIDSPNVGYYQETFGDKMGKGAVKFGQMLLNIPEDNFLFIKNCFDVKKIPTYIGITALTFALSEFDRRGWNTEHLLYKNNPLFHKTVDATVLFGDGKLGLILSGIFAAEGLITSNDQSLITASRITEAVLSSGLFVQLLKHITGRMSPAVAKSRAGEFDFFPSIKQYMHNQPEFYSFPSGHLAAAAATFEVLANEYPQEKWIRPLGYSAMGLLGISLVSKGMHWYSDLPLGFFIGYSFGDLITSGDKHNNNSDEKPALQFSPSLGSDKIGIQIDYSF